MQVASVYFFTCCLGILICCSTPSEVPAEEHSVNYIEGYYQPIYQADIAYLDGCYDTAWQLWQQAFSKYEPLNQPEYWELYHASEVAAYFNEHELALDYIEKLLRREGFEIKRFQKDSVFATLRETEGWKLLEKEYPTIRQAYLSSIDLSLRKEIRQMQKQDQLYRANREQFTDQKYIDSINLIDAINTATLISIFETVGYPDNQLIGHESVDGNWELNGMGIGTLLLHTADSIRMAYFVPKLLHFIERGRSEPRILGTLIDQFYLYNNEQQLYGTYTSSNGEELPVQYPEKVDSLRQSIGLPPLALQAERDRLLKEKFGY